MCLPFEIQVGDMFRFVKHGDNTDQSTRNSYDEYLDQIFVVDTLDDLGPNTEDLVFLWEEVELVFKV